LEYRNGIFKTTWDYTLVGLFFIVALPIVGFLALKERFL